MRHQRITAVWTLLLALVFALSGCGRKPSSVNENAGEPAQTEEAGMDPSVLLVIGEDEVSVGEASLVFRYAESLFSQEYPGVDITSGREAEAAARDALLEYTTQTLCAGHSGTEPEGSVTESVRVAVQSAGISDGFDEEIREAAIRDLAVQEQLQKEAMEAASAQVTEENTRVMRVKQIRRFYTDETSKAKQKKVMDKILKRLVEDKSTFAIQAAYYNEEEHIFRNLVRGDWEEEQAEEIFSLEKGKRTGILDDGESYCMFFCVTPLDETASADEYRDRLAETARREITGKIEAAVPADSLVWNEPARQAWIADPEG